MLPLVRRFVSETKHPIDWIQAHGVIFEEVSSMWPEKQAAKNLTWHIYPSKHGSSLIAAMTKTFKEKGGTLLTETPGKALIMKDGRAAGASRALTRLRTLFDDELFSVTTQA